MIHFEDLKVFSANTLCMIVLNVQNINLWLQTLLFVATIVYTFFRVANEVKKYYEKKSNK